VTGHSTVVVPLEGLPPVVPPLAYAEVVAHVVLVDPFDDRPVPSRGVLADLADYFADVVPFSVRLTHLAQLPGGAVHLALEDSTAVRNLASGLRRRFPELPRRATGLADLPHVDVRLGGDADLDRLQGDLAPWLPAVTLAREAALWWLAEDEHAVRTLATFPFGTTAA
jgi:hypothetical protein